jgi:hypothetical protein
MTKDFVKALLIAAAYERTVARRPPLATDQACGQAHRPQ